MSVAGTQADTPVVVATGVRHPAAYDDDSLKLMASSTGGVIVDAADLAKLRQHLLGLSTPNEPRTIRPLRSGWWERTVCAGSLQRMGVAPATRGPLIAMIDAYITYLRDVRRMAPNTVESYARDLASLAAFADKKRAGRALERQDLESLRAAADDVRTVAALGRARRRLRPRLLPVPGGRGKADESPADDLRPPRAWAALPKFLSLEEVDRLLDAAGRVDAARACATRR